MTKRVHEKTKRGKDGRVNTHLPFEERFWMRVNKEGPIPPHNKKVGRCWVWTGTILGRYGITRHNYQCYLVHRKSWEMVNGPVPEGLFVLHRCDNTLCVRPSHLFVGDTKDNMQDRDSKGRQARGETNGNHKLTETEVKEIIKTCRPGSSKAGFAAMGRKFNVYWKTVSRIVNGRRWRHITGDGS